MRIIDYLDARDFMNKSMVETYKEENIYFRQVFYILMLFLPINQPLPTVYFSNNKALDKLLEYNIYSKLTDNSLDSLFEVIMKAFFVNS